MILPSLSAELVVNLFAVPNEHRCIRSICVQIINSRTSTVKLKVFLFVFIVKKTIYWVISYLRWLISTLFSSDEDRKFDFASKILWTVV